MYIHSLTSINNHQSRQEISMKTTLTHSFTKPLSIALTGAALFTGLASAAEPASDPQALARELLAPTRTAPAISANVPSQSYASLPDAQQQARRLLLGVAGDLADGNKGGAARISRSQEPHEGRQSVPRVEARDLARRMILGSQA
jgi:hypothetical protein